MEFVLRLSDIANAGSISASDELTIIAGSVVLSESPAHQLKYWRKRFVIKQADLARKMNITSSVLSDYEKGRRPSPGVNFIKRYLTALAELKEQGAVPADKEMPKVASSTVADAYVNQN
jgi:putative transcriptional regulator